MNIQHIRVEINTSAVGKVKAYVTLHFIDENEVTRIILRGVTIKEKSYGVAVDFPGYATSSGKYRKPFLIQDKKEYWSVVQAVIDEYNSKTGEKIQLPPNEHVDPEDIPI